MTGIPKNPSASFVKRNPEIFGLTSPKTSGVPPPDVIEKDEGAMHDKFLDWLRSHTPAIPYVYSRRDRKPTIRAGWPDVTVLHGLRCVAIEFKMPGGRLSEDQIEVHAELSAVGVPVKVCYSLAEAIEFTRATLGLERSRIGAKQ